MTSPGRSQDLASPACLLPAGSPWGHLGHPGATCHTLPTEGGGASPVCGAAPPRPQSPLLRGSCLVGASSRSSLSRGNGAPPAARQLLQPARQLLQPASPPPPARRSVPSRAQARCFASTRPLSQRPAAVIRCLASQAVRCNSWLCCEVCCCS